MRFAWGQRDRMIWFEGILKYKMTGSGAALVLNPVAVSNPFFIKELSILYFCFFGYPTKRSPPKLTQQEIKPQRRNDWNRQFLLILQQQHLRLCWQSEANVLRNVAHDVLCGPWVRPQVRASCSVCSTIRFGNTEFLVFNPDGFSWLNICIFTSRTAEHEQDVFSPLRSAHCFTGLLNIKGVSK